MSEVQQSDSGSSKGKHGKIRAKKNSTHIDMTPMVDLAFLLLTFFMLTTTFGKPKTMEINMPVKDPTNKPQEVNNAITMLLTGDDKAFWYYGELKPETKLTPTNFSSDGIRKLLLDYNKFAVEQIKDLRAQALKIEESLKNDPDFVKSYDNSKKKAEARGEKFVPMNEREIVALIAYIQRLGTDIKVKK